MRKTRLPFIATLAIGLVAGGAVGAAAQDATEATPSAFTIEAGWAAGCTDGTATADGTGSTGWSCGPQEWTATDSRFSGTASNTWDHATYELDDGTYSVTVGYQMLENDGGSWICTYEQLETGVGLQSRPIDGGYLSTCTGNGGYDGLSAILSFESAEGQSGVRGLLFEGELPPNPGMAA